VNKGFHKLDERVVIGWISGELEIRSVEHDICPIAEFTRPLLSCAAILAIRS